MSSLLNNTSTTTRFWMAMGILFSQGFFNSHKKRGYYVMVKHNDREVHDLLKEAFGGTVGWRDKKQGYWAIWGRDKVEALLERVKPYIRQAQWTGWLQSIGQISKALCSGCGARKGEPHEVECYLS